MSTVDELKEMATITYKFWINDFYGSSLNSPHEGMGPETTQSAGFVPNFRDQRIQLPTRTNITQIS